MLDPMDVRQRRKRGSESENLALRIVNLSERRQQIIRPVLANPRKFVLLRVRDLAKEFGADAATSLVTFLEYSLTLLDLPVFAGIGHGRIVHLARAAKKSDIAIAISFRRGLRMTVEGLEQARTNGAYCVGVADSLLSPLFRFAHTTFLLPVETPSFGVSYVAPMALFNALLAACANIQRRRTLTLLREVDREQRHGSRW